MRAETRAGVHEECALLMSDYIPNWNFSKIYEHQISLKSTRRFYGSYMRTGRRTGGMAKLIGQRLQYLFSKAPRMTVCEFPNSFFLFVSFLPVLHF
jgi:hypothetical protein